MAKTINERITALKSRRSGEDRFDLLVEDKAALANYIGKMLREEVWEKKASNKPTRVML